MRGIPGKGATGILENAGAIEILQLELVLELSLVSI